MGITMQLTLLNQLTLFSFKTIFFKFSLSFAILFIFSSSAFTADITVYRWVDKNNIVHFSQNQPATDNFIELKMADAYNTSTRNIDAVDESSNEKNKEEDETLEFPLLTNEKCKSAKKNVSTLLEFDKIQSTDTDGKIKVLTAKEKAQQLSINRKQVEVYCAI